MSRFNEMANIKLSSLRMKYVGELDSARAIHSVIYEFLFANLDDAYERALNLYLPLDERDNLVKAKQR